MSEKQTKRARKRLREFVAKQGAAPMSKHLEKQMVRAMLAQIRERG